MPVKQTPVGLLRTASSGAAVLALLLGLLLGCTGTAAAAPAGTQQLTWSVQPSSPKKPDSRSSFTYQGFTPGSTHEDFVAVDNFGTSAETFSVYASDAFNTAAGGFDLLAAGQRPTDVGAWVHLAESSVRVPARSSVIVPFTVTVPDNATPGFHVGGIVASLSSLDTAADGSQVRVDRRVGVRIYLQVTGPLRPALRVEHYQVQYHDSWNPTRPGSATVSYTLANTGNVPLAAHQSLHSAGVLGVFGANQKLADAPLLLPGNSIRLTVQVPRAWPGLQLDTSLRVTPFTSIVTLAQPPASVDASGSAWAVPWVWLAIVIALALIWWGRRRLRRRRAARAQLRPAADRTPVSA